MSTNQGWKFALWFSVRIACFLDKKERIALFALVALFVKSELLSSFTLVDLLKRAIRTLLFFAKNCEINV